MTTDTITTETVDTADATAPQSGVRNGVDTTALFATLDVVKSDPEIAQFQFRAENTWLKGTHNRSVIHGFYGAKQEMEHRRPTVLEADHPTVLVGADNAPTPVEYLLHAIAACLTAGIANIAAARRVNLTEVSSTVEGDINVLGLLGLDNDVRNGYSGLRLTFTMKGDEPEKLRSVLEQSVRRSAVYDVLTNGVPISIDVVTD